MATRSRTSSGGTSQSPVKTAPVRTAPINEAPGNAAGSADDDLDPTMQNDTGSEPDRETGAEVVASKLEHREIPSFSEDRETRIAEAAYWRAERRGFQSGAELDDWLAAEQEIDGRKEETDRRA